MNRVYCLPRYRFSQVLSELTEQQFSASAFISINDPELKSPIDGVGPNILKLYFHDVDEYIDPDLVDWLGDVKISFDPDMAREVKEFVEANKGAKTWIIHCTAGQCRSGAIGEYVAQAIGVDYMQFKRDNPQVMPNSLVKKLLNND